MNNIDTFSRRHIICPYCGNEHNEDYDFPVVYYEDGNYDYTCSECFKEFQVYTEVIYCYITEKIEGDAE